MDKGKGKAINIFKLLINQRSTYSKTTLAKTIFNTFCKTFTNKAVVRKSRTPINITTREINIYILTIRAKYNGTLFYKRTGTRR